MYFIGNGFQTVYYFCKELHLRSHRVPGTSFGIFSQQFQVLIDCNTNVLRSIFTMILREAMLKRFQSNVGWKTYQRREPIVPYQKTISKSACCWSFRFFFFCSLQVSLGRFRLYLTLCGSFQVVSCSLQVVSGRFLLVVGRFRSFLAHCRSFQVVSCSLQVVSGRFLLVVGRFRLFLARCRSFQVVPCSFLARCRSFQVVSCLLQVVSGRFLLVVGRFRSFLARCRSFQVVLGRSAFQ